MKTRHIVVLLGLAVITSACSNISENVATDIQEPLHETSSIGTDSNEKSTYAEAMQLFDEGQYDKARGLFACLGNYEDSEAMVNLCEYEIAIQLLSDGNYGEAHTMFMALGNYKDSAEMLSECRYRKGIELLEQNDPSGAKERFLFVGNYKDAPRLLDECERMMIAHFSDFKIHEQNYLRGLLGAVYRDTFTNTREIENNPLAMYIIEMARNEYYFHNGYNVTRSFNSKNPDKQFLLGMPVDYVSEAVREIFNRDLRYYKSIGDIAGYELYEDEYTFGPPNGRGSYFEVIAGNVNVDNGVYTIEYSVNYLDGMGNSTKEEDYVARVANNDHETYIFRLLSVQTRNDYLKAPLAPIVPDKLSGKRVDDTSLEIINGECVYTNETMGVKIKFPKEWEARLIIELYNENSFTIYNKANYWLDIGGITYRGGDVCYIVREKNSENIYREALPDDMYYREAPFYITDEYSYFVYYPNGVMYDGENETRENDYLEIISTITGEWLAEHMEVFGG